MLDEREVLDRRLELARARRDREPAFSPDWDAATEEIACVSDRLRRLGAEPGRDAGGRDARPHVHRR